MASNNERIVIFGIYPSSGVSRKNKIEELKI
jgi:hypothetical protein